ncbi:acyl-CoA dehydrogenase family protein [Pseudonocardia acaciae]|uniref:acyl-CoA dehydrogenase family protein n=1 Tax=Pseudonocardia acaciae TaxID=551276 RepID=UPI0005674CF1|nr:acyl-CoA dehydrogenase family protein [Pseudonocardia acaciae]
MNGLELSDEQRALVEVLDAVTNGLDDDLDVSEAAAELAARGLWALGTPEALGGGGASRATALLAVQRIARVSPPLALACAHADAAAHLLARPLPDGALAALVDARSSTVHLDARTHENGRVRLTGTIDRIEATGADPLLVVLDPTVPGAAVLAAGVTYGPLQHTTGLKGRRRATLDADCDLDPAADTATARTRLRLGCAAVACGIAEAAVDLAVGYAGEREQFGDVLLALPPVRAALAEARLRQRRATQALFALAAAPPDPDPDAAAEALRGATQSAIEVTTAAVQAHGGYGYLREYRAERLLRDAISLRAASGALDAARHAADSLGGHR